MVGAFGSEACLPPLIDSKDPIATSYSLPFDIIKNYMAKAGPRFTSRALAARQLIFDQLGLRTMKYPL